MHAGKVNGFTEFSWNLFWRFYRSDYWEWVQDWYDESCYKNSSRDNPTGPSSGSYRVLRGGGWSGSAKRARSSDRNTYNPDRRSDYLGFRLLFPLVQ